MKLSDIKETPSGVDNCVELSENDTSIAVYFPTSKAKEDFISAAEKAIEDRKKLIEEQEAQIDKVAAPKAAAAAAILSSQYAALKETSEGKPVQRRRNSVFGTGTYNKAARKMTFYNMSVDEKWQVAEEAKDELRKLSMRRKNKTKQKIQKQYIETH